MLFITAWIFRLLLSLGLGWDCSPGLVSRSWWGSGALLSQKGQTSQGWVESAPLVWESHSFGVRLPNSIVVFPPCTERCIWGVQSAAHPPSHRPCLHYCSVPQLVLSHLQLLHLQTRHGFNPLERHSWRNVRMGGGKKNQISAFGVTFVSRRDP